jgi:hypothetical protein
MALICPVCSTENRDGAHFCRSCGTTLSARPPGRPDSPAAQPRARVGHHRARPVARADHSGAAVRCEPRARAVAPQPSRSFGGRPAAVPGDDDDQTVLMVLTTACRPAGAARGVADLRVGARRAERKKARAKVQRPVPVEPPPRKRVVLLWLGLLAVAVAMVVAGWYGYGTRKAPAVEQSDAAPAADTPRIRGIASAAPLPHRTRGGPRRPPSPFRSSRAGRGRCPAAEAALPRRRAKPAAKPRKQATAARRSPALRSPWPPSPPRRRRRRHPAPPPEPQAQCGDRNFIAKAQCMAAQCLKPEFKAHAQCEAVRRQQRLEEEKRNPTLIN